MKFLLTVPLLAISIAVSHNATAQTPHPVRVAIVGLVHGHVGGFLHHLPAPRASIEQAAPLHIAAMVEKPLATTVEDALAIEHIAQRYNIPILTNYETTWYNSNIAAANMLSKGQTGELRKLVIHDGHKGPKEINVGPEFLSWLTDPKLNGGGALFDFGCYGVDLATWIMHGELPLTVTAITLPLKPSVYPHVDDDSTVILTYPHAQAIIQGSWNWPFNRKDMEVYGATGYIDTLYEDHNPGAKLRLRLPGETSEHVETAPTLAAPQDNSLNYLVAVLNGTLHPTHDLTALDTNVTVVRILDAGRRPDQTGRTIHL